MARISNKIYVDGIRENITEMKLKSYFSVFGLVKNVSILREASEVIGYGFVEFIDPETVDLIIGIIKLIIF